jgi:hypothetical protein
MKKIMGSKIEKQPLAICADKPHLSTLPRWVSHLLSWLLAFQPFLLTASLSMRAVAAPVTSTAVYVIEGGSTGTARNIRTIDPTTGALSATIFTTGVTSSASLAVDPISLMLYYADRTTSPNQLRRYDGTTESGSIGTFAGTSSSTVILRMGFRGTTGYAIDSSNNIFSFTNTAPSTITPLGAVSFQGSSPSGSTSSGDIAFDGNGRGWAIFGNSLYRMDFNASPITAYPI